MLKKIFQHGARGEQCVRVRGGEGVGRGKEGEWERGREGGRERDTETEIREGTRPPRGRLTLIEYGTPGPKRVGIAADHSNLEAEEEMMLEYECTEKQ